MWHILPRQSQAERSHGWLKALHFVAVVILALGIPSPTRGTTSPSCRGCEKLWELARIENGTDFIELNRASGRLHKDLVLVKANTTADLALAQQLFRVDTLISAQEDSSVDLYFGSYSQGLLLEEGVVLTLQNLILQNVIAIFASDGSGGNINATSNNSSTSTGGTSGWSLSLDAFELSRGSLLRLVRTEVVLADCGVARQLYDAAGQQQQQQQQQQAGAAAASSMLANVTQGQVPDVRIAYWSSAQLEMRDVYVTCSQVCDPTTGVRTLPVASAASLYDAFAIVDDHLDGCSAYVVQLATNVSLAAALSAGQQQQQLQQQSTWPSPPPPSPPGNSASRRLMALQASGTGTWGRGGAGNGPRRGSLYGTADWRRRQQQQQRGHDGLVLPYGGSQRRLLGTIGAASGTAGPMFDVSANLTIRGSSSSASATVLDTSQLSSLLRLRPPASLAIEQLTLTNLAVQQTGVLALPLYLVDAASRLAAANWTSNESDASSNSSSSRVSNAGPRVLLRNVTLVMAGDELSYLISWLKAYKDKPTTLDSDQVAWLQGIVRDAKLQSLALSTLALARFRIWDINATNLRLTSVAPVGFTLVQPIIGLSHFSSTPLEPYPQIVVLNSSAGLAAVLNASTGSLVSPGNTAYTAYPGVPTQAAVSLLANATTTTSTAASLSATSAITTTTASTTSASSSSSTNVTTRVTAYYAPVPYGNVVLKRSYVLGSQLFFHPYPQNTTNATTSTNSSSSTATSTASSCSFSPADPPAVLDFGGARSTWASFASSGLWLALRNLTLIGLDSPARWPAASPRLVRCLDLPLWALQAERLPSLAGEPPALRLAGVTLSVSSQELALWAACYEVLTANGTSSSANSSSSQASGFTQELEVACESLGLRSFVAKMEGAHAFKIYLLEGMGMQIKDSVLRDDILPYHRYDIADLLPGLSPRSLSPPSPSSVDTQSSGRSRKWVIPLAVIVIMVFLATAAIIYVYIRSRRGLEKDGPYVNVHMTKMMNDTGLRSYAMEGLEKRSSRRPAGSDPWDTGRSRSVSRLRLPGLLSRSRSTRPGPGDGDEGDQAAPVRTVTGEDQQLGSERGGPVEAGSAASARHRPGQAGSDASRGSGMVHMGGSGNTAPVFNPVRASGTVAAVAGVGAGGVEMSYGMPCRQSGTANIGVAGSAVACEDGVGGGGDAVGGSGGWEYSMYNATADVAKPDFNDGTWQQQQLQLQQFVGTMVGHMCAAGCPTQQQQPMMPHAMMTTADMEGEGVMIMAMPADTATAVRQAAAAPLLGAGAPPPPGTPATALLATDASYGGSMPPDPLLTTQGHGTTCGGSTFIDSSLAGNVLESASFNPAQLQAAGQQRMVDMAATFALPASGGGSGSGGGCAAASLEQDGSAGRPSSQHGAFGGSSPLVNAIRQLTRSASSNAAIVSHRSAPLMQPPLSQSRLQPQPQRSLLGQEGARSAGHSPHAICVPGGGGDRPSVVTFSVTKRSLKLVEGGAVATDPRFATAAVAGVGNSGESGHSMASQGSPRHGSPGGTGEVSRSAMPSPQPSWPQQHQYHSGSSGGFVEHAHDLAGGLCTAAALDAAGSGGGTTAGSHHRLPPPASPTTPLFSRTASTKATSHGGSAGRMHGGSSSGGGGSRATPTLRPTMAGDYTTSTASDPTAVANAGQLASPRPMGRRTGFQANSSMSRLSEATWGRSDSSRSTALLDGVLGGGSGGSITGVAAATAVVAGPSAGGGPNAHAADAAAHTGSGSGGAGGGGTSGGGGTVSKPGFGKLLVGSLSTLFRVDNLTVGLQKNSSPPPSLTPSGGSGTSGAPSGRYHRAESGPSRANAGGNAGQGSTATGTTVRAGRTSVNGPNAGGAGASGGGGGAGSAGRVSTGPAGLGATLTELSADMERSVNENQLVIQQPLGAGAFGTVYKALWKGLPVAVKTMTLTSDAVTQGRHAALVEAALSKSIYHANVVTTYTCDLKPMHVDSHRGGAMTGLHITNETEVIQEWRLYIVQEYCDGGSLRHAIEARSFLNPATGSPQLEWVLQMAREVASGLQYLHEHNIIHGDLNPANVLLKHDDGSVLGYTAKIADFGLSVHMQAEQSHVSNTKRGTPFYTAPEVTHAGNLTRFADVFSYGVLLWELYCSRSCWTYGPQGRLVQQRGFPHLPPTCPRSFAQLVSACMQPAHKQRPTFKQIGQQLEGMLRDCERAAVGGTGDWTVASGSGMEWRSEDGRRPMPAQPPPPQHQHQQQAWQGPQQHQSPLRLTHSMATLNPAAAAAAGANSGSGGGEHLRAERSSSGPVGHGYVRDSGAVLNRAHSTCAAAGAAAAAATAVAEFPVPPNMGATSGAAAMPPAAPYVQVVSPVVAATAVTGVESIPAGTPNTSGAAFLGSCSDAVAAAAAAAPVAAAVGAFAGGRSYAAVVAAPSLPLPVAAVAVESTRHNESSGSGGSGGGSSLATPCQQDTPVLGQPPQLPQPAAAQQPSEAAPAATGTATLATIPACALPPLGAAAVEEEPAAAAVAMEAGPTGQQVDASRGATYSEQAGQAGEVKEQVKVASAAATGEAGMASAASVDSAAAAPSVAAGAVGVAVDPFLAADLLISPATSVLVAALHADDEPKNQEHATDTTLPAGGAAPAEITAPSGSANVTSAPLGDSATSRTAAVKDTTDASPAAAAAATANAGVVAAVASVAAPPPAAAAGAHSGGGGSSGGTSGGSSGSSSGSNGAPGAFANVMRAFEIPSEVPRFGRPDLPTVHESDGEEAATEDGVATKALLPAYAQLKSASNSRAGVQKKGELAAALGGVQESAGAAAASAETAEVAAPNRKPSPPPGSATAVCGSSAVPNFSRSSFKDVTAGVTFGPWSSLRRSSLRRSSTGPLSRLSYGSVPYSGGLAPRAPSNSRTLQRRSVDAPGMTFYSSVAPGAAPAVPPQSSSSSARSGGGRVPGFNPSQAGTSSQFARHSLTARMPAATAAGSSSASSTARPPPFARASMPSIISASATAAPAAAGPAAASPFARSSVSAAPIAPAPAASRTASASPFARASLTAPPAAVPAAAAAAAPSPFARQSLAAPSPVPEEVPLSAAAMPAMAGPSGLPTAAASSAGRFARASLVECSLPPSSSTVTGTDYTYQQPAPAAVPAKQAPGTSPFARPSLGSLATSGGALAQQLQAPPPPALIDPGVSRFARASLGVQPTAALVEASQQSYSNPYQPFHPQAYQQQQQPYQQQQQPYQMQQQPYQQQQQPYQQLAYQPQQPYQQPMYYPQPYHSGMGIPAVPSSTASNPGRSPFVRPSMGEPTIDTGAAYSMTASSMLLAPAAAAPGPTAGGPFCRPSMGAPLQGPETGSTPMLVGPTLPALPSMAPGTGAAAAPYYQQPHAYHMASQQHMPAHNWPSGPAVASAAAAGPIIGSYQATASTIAAAAAAAMQQPAGTGSASFVPEVAVAGAVGTAAAAAAMEPEATAAVGSAYAYQPSQQPGTSTSASMGQLPQQAWATSAMQSGPPAQQPTQYPQYLMQLHPQQMSYSAPQVLLQQQPRAAPGPMGQSGDSGSSFAATAVQRPGAAVDQPAAAAAQGSQYAGVFGSPVLTPLAPDGSSSIPGGVHAPVRPLTCPEAPDFARSLQRRNSSPLSMVSTATDAGAIGRREPGTAAAGVASSYGMPSNTKGAINIPAPRSSGSAGGVATSFNPSSPMPIRGSVRSGGSVGAMGGGGGSGTSWHAGAHLRLGGSQGPQSYGSYGGGG
ncbi:hypothetical protein Agub_g10746, partial [Astrephomene gubernaculifera]